MTNFGKRIQVCHSAFLSLHGEPKKRVYRICNILSRGELPCDERGESKSGSAISPEKCELIKDIEQFQVKISHNGGKDFMYLHARSNITIIYTLFKKEHPNIKMSYWFYWQYFKKIFDLRLGRHQVDTCSICEEKCTLLRSNHISDAEKSILLPNLYYTNTQQKSSILK